MESMETAVEVKHLTKRYGAHTAIEDVSFSIMRGEVVGFLGPNGAGKTTTMRILAGLMSASSGCAYIHGIPVAQDPRGSKRCLGYMPENNPLPDDLRVEEYLRLRAQLKEVPRREVAKHVQNVMELCDLHHKAKKRPIGSLSKGYRQRVGIADTLLGEPKVIIMDEPTVGLDPHQVIAIRKLIESLRGSMTLVFSSHILQEVEISCTRVIILNQGRIVANGNLDALRREFIPFEVYHIVTNANPQTLENLLKGMEPHSFLASKMPFTDGFQDIQWKRPLESAVKKEEVLAAICKMDAQVREFYVEKANLEPIFLAATQRSWELRKGIHGDTPGQEL